MFVNQDLQLASLANIASWIDTNKHLSPLLSIQLFVVEYLAASSTRDRVVEAVINIPSFFRLDYKNVDDAVVRPVTARLDNSYHSDTCYQLQVLLAIATVEIVGSRVDDLLTVSSACSC